MTNSESTRKFQAFMGPPFRVDSELVIGVSAVVAHKDKYELLGGIANAWADRIEEDHVELDKQGYTSAERARAFAALAETMVAEQYAMLDGLRRAIYSVYRRVTGVQNQSTYKLFERAAKGEYGPEFSAELCAELTDAFATWFPRLRLVRTLTTHGDTGNCYMNRKTKVISYFHLGNRRSGGDVRIDDVVAWGNTSYLKIVALTELFFKACFLALEPVEHRQVCGIYRGRAYERMVAAAPDLSFADGRCWSRPWFETQPGYDCPMRVECAAYGRPVAKEERDAYFNKTRPPKSEPPSPGSAG
jgi:hypothetical protein